MTKVTRAGGWRKHHKLPRYCLNAAIMLRINMQFEEAQMGSKNSGLHYFSGRGFFIGGIVYLSQAVEPPRDTALDVLDNQRFQQ